MTESSRVRQSTARWLRHAVVVGLLGVLANIGLTVALLVKIASERACWAIGCQIA
jgi:hypothetical protein